MCRLPIFILFVFLFAMALSIVLIDEFIVSTEIFDTYFLCDYDKCKGACCIEGEGGAPVERKEQELIIKSYPIIESYLDSESLEYIGKKGILYYDHDGDLVTNIINGGRCVFSIIDGADNCRCAFEKAYSDGYNEVLYKPISCHLYPIRVTRLNSGMIAMNYHRWQPICECAREKGVREHVRLYQFLREPLVRAFGEDFYHKLENEAEKYINGKV